MVKLLKQRSDIFALRKAQRVQRVDYKGTTNANPVNDVKQKISSLTERNNISETER